MKATTIRDLIRRIHSQEHQNKKKYLKSLKLNNKFSLTLKSQDKLSQIPKKKLRNRCIITGRGRAILKDFKLSRCELYQSCSISKIPGLVKASW